MELQDSILETESQRLLGRSYASLHPHEQTVVAQIIQRGSVARDLAHEQDQALTFGQRLADRVAAVGGSWAFIIGFGIWLAAWIILNAVILRGMGLKGFDPYPFIFLNLMLSMLAAKQATEATQRAILEAGMAAKLAEVNATLDPHEQLSCMVVISEAWTVESGMITPTFKVKRNRIEEVYGPLFEDWTAQRKKVLWHAA